VGFTKKAPELIRGGRRQKAEGQKGIKNLVVGLKQRKKKKV
jgi:hypothetical protein